MHDHKKKTKLYEHMPACFKSKQSRNGEMSGTHSDVYCHDTSEMTLVTYDIPLYISLAHFSLPLPYCCWNSLVISSLLAIRLSNFYTFLTPLHPSPYSSAL
jgi:hypothetical protein